MSLSLSRYSEKAIAVFGNSKPYYGNLTQLGGGKWAEHITNKDTGVKGGWIFYNAKEKELRELIDKINKKQVEPIGKEEVVQEEKKTLTRSNESSKLLTPKSKEFEFSKEMYLAMKSEIERLTNDVSILLSYIEKKPDNPFIATPQKKLVVKVPQAPLKKPIKRKEESEGEKQSSSEEEESDDEQAGIPKKSFLF